MVSSLLSSVLLECQRLLGDLKRTNKIGDFTLNYSVQPEEEQQQPEEEEALKETLKAILHLLEQARIPKIPPPSKAQTSSPLSCTVCSRHFTTEGRLKRHVSISHQNDPPSKSVFACRIKACRRRFASEELLRSHSQHVHGGDEETSSKEDGEEPDLPFRCCERCNKCFRTVQDAEAHPGCVGPVSTIKSLSLLQAHNRFGCGYCNEEYRQFSRVKYHLEKCQGGPYTCELCELVFEQRRLLTAHKAEKHSTEEPFRCKECPKRFKLNNSLQKHLAGSHERDSTSHKCDKCGKRFVKKVYLTNHQTRFHNLFKPFLCAECGDRFTSAASLASHLEIHEGVKKFACPVCDKQFRRRDKLKFHLQALHTGERPHRCHVCQKGFVRKSKLQDHVRRHTGEKRFSCLVCNKMYSGSYDLRLHLQRHHPNVGRGLKANKPVVPQQQQAIQTAAASMKLEASVSAQDEFLQDTLQIDMEELTQACGGQIDFSDDAFIDPQEFT